MVDKGIVLSLYDHSGVMVEPWADAGYTCFVVDIKHQKGCNKHLSKPNIFYWGVDILSWLPPREDYRIAFSFSPCDDMSVSGARWFQQKGLYRLSKAIELFAKGLDICEWTGAPYCLEHPKSTISTYYRTPDHMIHPHYFDHLTKNDENYSKETYLWIGNGFILPMGLKSQTPDINKIHYMAPGHQRTEFRANTPQGFARAVFEVNHKE